MARIPLNELQRQDVFERDDYTCRYCGHRPEFFHTWQGGRWHATLHVDHVIPVCAGGMNTRSNLVTACARCNLRKGARYTAAHVAYVRDIEHEQARREAGRITAMIEDGEFAEAYGNDYTLVNV